MYRVIERKVNRMVRIRDGREGKSNVSIRYDIYFPHPQQFLRQLSVGGTLVRVQ